MPSANILIINQHGENRGDEAAMLAMLERLRTRADVGRFRLLYQSRDRDLRPIAGRDVDAYPIVMPVREGLGLAVYAALLVVGLRARFVLGSLGRSIVAAYQEADLVVSAPGGPYFGDHYADHELVHWFFVWLAALHRKPAFLYAPSAGPFRKRWLNPIRRRSYRIFARLTAREEISARLIDQLLGEDGAVTVTADSALQVEVPPIPRGEFFAEREELAERFILAVSALDYDNRKAGDSKRREDYRSALCGAVAGVARRRRTHVLWIPQLYGAHHDDTPFLHEMAARLPSDVSQEVLSRELDAGTQRALFAMADMFIGSRYHPCVFAASAGVPGICIYYEHKALGFMRAMGLEDLAFDIRELSAGSLDKAVDRVLDDAGAIRERLRERAPIMRDRARRTTEFAVELLPEKWRRG